MSSDSSDDRQRILLVTGMLGAGKTTALRELENLGWEALDNFPIRFLGRLIEPEADAEGDSAPIAIGFDCRTRGFAPANVIARVRDLTSRQDLVISTMFLDCSDPELERRFNETRRRHHLAQEMPVPFGIAAERQLLEPLRNWADILIDTSHFSANELQQTIRQQFAFRSPGQLTVTVSSFGFARGMPPVADLVFDMRFLDNPHWEANLRALTGQDEAVGRHIAADPGFENSFTRIRDLLLDLLPRYSAQGKNYVNIAFGCTGGRHRSVYVAERIAQALRDAGFSPTVLHRNLGSRAAEMIEGPQQP